MLPDPFICSKLADQFALFRWNTQWWYCIIFVLYCRRLVFPEDLSKQSIGTNWTIDGCFSILTGDASKTSLDPEVGINIYSKLNHPQQQQQQKRLPQQDRPSERYHTLEPASISPNKVILMIRLTFILTWIYILSNIDYPIISVV